MKILGVGNGNSGNHLLKVRQDINFAKKSDSYKESLQKQIFDVKKRMEELDSNTELTFELKKDKKKVLQQKLNELNKLLFERELQIRKEQERKQQEKLKEKIEETQPKTKEEEINTNLFKVTETMNKIKHQSRIKTKLKGDLRILASEIKMDSSRGVNAEEKIRAFAKLEDKIKKLDKQIGEELMSINKEIKKLHSKLNKKSIKGEDKDKEKDQTTNKADSKDEKAEKSPQENHVDKLV